MQNTACKIFSITTKKQIHPDAAMQPLTERERYFLEAMRAATPKERAIVIKLLQK